MLAASCCGSGPDGAGPDGRVRAGPWKPMPAPGPGDWLYIHPEKSQPFDEFVRERSQYPKPARESVLCIQPLGNISTAHPELMKDIADYVSVFFDRKAVLLEPLPIPEASFNARRSQYDAGVVLGFLSAKARPGCCACIGVLERDLFLDGFAFLYGLGSLRKGVGVCSVARYNFEYIGMDPACTFERRSMKVAVHELCHALGMRHCTNWLCVLNGANSIVEADRSPMHLCPDCIEKLAWLMEFDTEERYGKLCAFFAGRKGFEKEASFAADAAAALGAGKRNPKAQG